VIQKHKKAPNHTVPIDIIEAMIEASLDLVLNCLISYLERKNV